MEESVQEFVTTSAPAISGALGLLERMRTGGTTVRPVLPLDTFLLLSSELLY